MWSVGDRKVNPNGRFLLPRITYLNTNRWLTKTQHFFLGIILNFLYSLFVWGFYHCGRTGVCVCVQVPVTSPALCQRGRSDAPPSDPSSSGRLHSPRPSSYWCGNPLVPWVRSWSWSLSWSWLSWLTWVGSSTTVAPCLHHRSSLVQDHTGLSYWPIRLIHLLLLLVSMLH